MSKASTNLNNANITDDYVSPATDVWMTDVEQSQSSSDMTWPIGEFPGWPVLIAENVTTFEDPDLIETGVPIEISLGELKTIFVTAAKTKHRSRFDTAGEINIIPWYTR